MGQTWEGGPVSQPANNLTIGVDGRTYIDLRGEGVRDPQKFQMKMLLRRTVARVLFPQ